MTRPRAAKDEQTLSLFSPDAIRTGVHDHPEAEGRRSRSGHRGRETPHVVGTKNATHEGVVLNRSLEDIRADHDDHEEEERRLHERPRPTRH